VIGPLARSADDLDLVMGLITRSGKPLQTAWKLALPVPRKNTLQEFKVGICLDDPAFPVDANVADPLQHLVDVLAAAGVSISEKHPDISLKACHDIYSRLLTAVPNPLLSDEILKHFYEEAPKLSPVDKSFRAQLMRGATMSHRDWIVLDYQRLMMRQRWADYFRDVDVLLCPAAPVTAFTHDLSDFFQRTLEVNGRPRPYFDTMAAWAGLTCVSYLPATVAPVGIAANGLPVGVQIVGPYLEDRTTIHFARLLETVTGGFAPPSGF
jgi:amidase